MIDQTIDNIIQELEEKDKQNRIESVQFDNDGNQMSRVCCLERAAAYREAIKIIRKYLNELQ